MTGKRYHKNHHKISTFSFTRNIFFLWFDIILIIISSLAILANFFRINFLSDVNILISVAVAGFFPVFFSAIKALLNKKLTIDLLASIALAFSFLSKEWHSAVFISLMLASARLLTYYTDSKTRQAIKSLLKLRPEKVHIKNNGEIIEKNIEDIKIGDLVVVDAGERIAVDGVVISGNASIDQSSLTGESEPLVKTAGDEVLSSTLNVYGSLVVLAKKIGEDTTFAKTLKLVEDSQQSKAHISSIAEKFITYYIFITLAGSLIFYLFFQNLNKVLSILLVTCADDLAIAIPLAFMAAITVAAREGIIIKGANFIEGFAKVKAIIFDKTGTITEGKPKVKDIIVFKNLAENDFLSILGAMVIESNHPMSKAVARLVKEKNIKIAEASEIYEMPGYGVRGIIAGKKIFGGSVKFLEDNGIKFSEDELAAINKERSERRLVVSLGIGQEAMGYVALSDNIRHNAAHIIDWLKAMGVEKIAMLTGDNEVVANQVAKETHIPEFRANLLPQDKVNFIKGILSKRYKTVMVGDGVNDAAALSLADIGVAMGAIGSDAAIESADIALMKDNLRNIGDIMKLSHYVLKIVRQDFFLWAIINSLGLILVFTNVLNPTGAAAFNFITDFIPLINSVRIFRFKFKNGI
jgi:heavy metal translocating P-type ATPase